MYARARQTGRRDPARFFVGEGLTAVLRYGGWALVCRLALSLNLRITELKGLLDRPASQNWRLRSHMPQRYLRECRAESDRTWGSLAARPPKHMDDAKGRLGPWNLTDEMVRSIVSERSKLSENCPREKRACGLSAARREGVLAARIGGER